MEFEIRAGQLQRAKKLLYRAVRECPLVKGTATFCVVYVWTTDMLYIELYLLAFVQLRSVFSARELNGLAETMVERGIRMREDLEQILDEWPTAGGWMNEENAGEQDIAHNAEELRRLMPY